MRTTEAVIRLVLGVIVAAFTVGAFGAWTTERTLVWFGIGVLGVVAVLFIVIPVFRRWKRR